jgi:putative membrane protein
MHEHLPATNGALSLSFILLSGVLVLYVVATRVSNRRRLRSWSPWRTASFTAGLAVLALALAPPVAAFAHQDFRGHVVQHLLIGMLAPLGLVLGAPVTLLLRTLPVGAGRSVVAVLRSQPLRWLSHPLTGLLLAVGGMYLLYLSPLYHATMTHPLLHHLLNFHFFAAGFLFTAALVSPDPQPHRASFRTRTLVLFVAIAAHTSLSKMMYAYHLPRTDLHSLGELQAGAQLMYYGGDAVELLLIIALFSTWYVAASSSPPGSRFCPFTVG